MNDKVKTTKKPLRRKANGRFAENMAEFTGEALAQAIAEFENKSTTTEKDVQNEQG